MHHKVANGVPHHNTLFSARHKMPQTHRSKYVTRPPVLQRDPCGEVGAMPKLNARICGMMPKNTVLNV